MEQARIETKKDIIDRLQKKIFLWQGFKAPSLENNEVFGLGPVEHAFPNATFPTGAIHEFINASPEHAAASGGFIAGLLKTLMQNKGICLWVSHSRTLFPPALKLFGVEPDQVIFVDLQREKDVLWVMEEALKCEGLVSVIAEIREISFTESRRLQLAVEKSKVTGFILRNEPRRLNTTTCVARWRINPLPSELNNNMPGVGFPRWQVELLKVRNGNPGTWEMEWSANRFVVVPQESAALSPALKRKAG